MSAIQIRVIDNTQAFTRSKNEATIKILEEVGEAAVGHAKDIVPVDTGALRDSINYSLSDRAVILHADEEYAAYVELGTMYQNAQPYLRPAVEDYQGEYKDIAESIYRGDDVINPKRRIVYT